MGIILLVIGLLAIAMGVFLLAAPNLLVKASEVLNRVFVTDDVIFSRSRLFGILLLGAGIFMIYTYF